MSVSYTHLDVYKRQAIVTLVAGKTSFAGVCMADPAAWLAALDVYKRQTLNSGLPQAREAYIKATKVIVK